MGSTNRNSGQRDTVSVWQQPIDVDGANAPEVPIERAFLPDGFAPIRYGSPISGRLSLIQADGTTRLWATAHDTELTQALGDRTELIGPYVSYLPYVVMLSAAGDRLLVVTPGPDRDDLRIRVAPTRFDANVVEIPGRFAHRDEMPPAEPADWAQQTAHLTIAFERAVNRGSNLVLRSLPPHPGVAQHATATAVPGERIYVTRWPDDEDEAFVETPYRRRSLPIIGAALTEAAKYWTDTPLDAEIDFFPAHHPAEVPA